MDGLLPGGRRVRKKVPGTDAKTLKELAERLARAHWNELLKAEAGLAPDPLALGAPTLAEVLERDRGRPGAAPGTRETLLRQSRPLLRHLGAEARADSLSGADFERYKAARLADGVAPRTVNLELLHCLAPALRRAFADGLLASEPPAPRALPETPKRVRWLRLGELRALVAAAREGAGGAIRNAADAGDYIGFLAATGIRRGELMGNEQAGSPGFGWEDVDWRERTARVESAKRGARGGGPSARLVPLNADALAILERRRALGLPRPFPFRGRLNRWIKAAAKAAGLERAKAVSPHCLRHTFATLALQNGANVRDVAALLGDSVETTARVYLHESANGMRTAVQTLELWTADGPGGEPEGEKN